LHLAVIPYKTSSKFLKRDVFILNVKYDIVLRNNIDIRYAKLGNDAAKQLLFDRTLNVSVFDRLKKKEDLHD